MTDWYADDSFWETFQSYMFDPRRLAGLENRWIRIRGNERRESTLTLRLYSRAELEGVLRAGGFREVSLYGSLRATPYDQNAERLIAVASK